MDAADQLRRARRRAGLSQQQLAVLAETSPSLVAAYESGAERPTAATLSNLLTVLDVQPATSRRQPSAGTRGDELAEVLDLADAFPTRHHATLRYPPFGR